MDESNKFLIPGAIIVAGFIVAVAVIYSVSRPSTGVKNGEKTAALAGLPAVSSNDFVLGESNAPVTMIEYGDFQCPFCGRFFKETEPVLREKYIKTGKVKFIYRDFAFLGPESFWRPMLLVAPASRVSFGNITIIFTTTSEGKIRALSAKII